MLIYNRPYIILVATGDRAYVNLHPCDVLASVSLPEFAKLRSQLLDVFIISSDFDLAQHFSCSVKTVECGQLFILACGQ